MKYLFAIILLLSPAFAQAPVTCGTCMIQAQTAESAMQTCPNLLKIKNIGTYNSYRAMSLQVYKQDYHNKQIERMKVIMKKNTCPRIVREVNQGHMMYGLLASK